MEPKVTPGPVKVVSAPKVAASPKVCAPEVLTLLPLIATVPPALVLKLTKAALLPTAPPNTVSPVVLTANVNKPFKVSEKPMLPAPVLVSVVLAPKLAASPKLCAPEVLILPPLIATVPPALVVKLVKAVFAPTLPLKIVSPVVLMAKVYAPFKVSAKPMLPADVLVSVVLAPKLTASP